MDILLVDDEEAVLDQAEIFLKREDDRFDVDTALSVEEALQMYEERDYDIIVSDYQMPGKDGLDFLRVLRKEKMDDIPFIILTGKGREQVAVEALNLDADRYIHKGVDPKSQYSVVAEAIVREVEHSQAKDKIEDLNSLLRSIREINQLIIQEDELIPLMEKASEKLAETRNYKNIEIGFLDEKDEKIQPVATSGKYPRRRWEVDKEGDGKAPRCIRETVSRRTPIFIDDPERYCADCGYSQTDTPHNTVLLPITHQSELMGLISACYEKGKDLSGEEINLLEEVAGDLGMARKKIMIEEKLRESREKFKNLAETTSVGIMIYQDEGWVYANPAAEEISGYSFEELKDMKYWEFVAPRYKDLIKRRGFKRQEGEDIESGYEFKIITKEGEEKWVYLEGSSIEYEGEKAGLISVIDITDQKEKEEELRRRKERLERNEEKIKKLHDVAVEMESVVDEEELYEMTIEASNRILDFEVCSLDIVQDGEFEVKATIGGVQEKGTRYPIEGVAGKTYRNAESYLIEDLDEEEDAEPKRESYRSAISIPIGDYGVFQILSETRGDFDERDLEMAEILIHHTNQVLKRIRGEKKVRKSEEKYRELTEKVDDLIGKIDGEGKYTFVNKTHEKILGYSPDELIGREALEFIHEEDQEKVLEEFGKNLEEKEGKKSKIEARFKTRSGDYRWLEIKGRLGLDKNKRLMIARDITERKEKEKELLEKKYTIDSSQNAIAIADMSADVKYVNQAILNKWDYDEDEIIGEKPQRFFHDNEKVAQALEELMKKGEWRGDLKAERKDGSLFEVHLSADLIEDEGGEPVGISASMIDITERTELKKKLREKEEKIKGLHDMAMDLQDCRAETEAFDLAVRGGKKILNFPFCGIIIEKNGEDVLKSTCTEEIEEFERMLSLDDDPLEDICDKRDSSMINDLENSGQTELKDFKSCLTAPIDERGIFVAFSKEKNYFDKTDLELTELLVSHVTQILNRIERENELKTNKRRIQKLHEIGARLESCYDKNEIYDLTIQAAEDILDFDICEISVPDEGEMKPVAISSGHLEKSPEPLPMEESIAGKTMLEDRSFLIQEVEESEKANPTSDQYNSAISVPVGEHAVFQAVSLDKNNFDEEDLELLELLINHTTEALERTEMMSREEFLHSLLRHDVGNKTQIAKGYLELMRNKYEDEDFIDKTIDAINRTQEIIDKINQIRKVGRKEELGKINVKNVLDSVLSEYDTQLKEHEVEVRVEGSDSVVKGNVLLEEFFSNMIENSIRHSGCEVIRIDIQDEEDRCLCIYEDDGKGLSDGEKDKIFERGYKKGDKAGSGLGMFLVKEIVESFNGSIKVKDSDMGGVRFEVKLKKD